VVGVQGERDRWKGYPVALCLIVGPPVKAAQPLLRHRCELASRPKSLTVDGTDTMLAYRSHQGVPT